MQATNSTYNYLDSVDRIGEILNSSDTSYDDSKSIPSRDRLTFLNGFYVYVSVIFIDIRGSKELSNKHTRPVLAKIYRSYISEMVAVLRDNENVNEIYIEGDGVWAVYNTPYKQDLDSVFSTAARAASLNDILNVKLVKKGYSKFNIGIGLDYGESLYIKAGYKSSGINEVVWVGKVVGGAAKLCSEANRSLTYRTMVSSVFYSNLNEHNKKLLSQPFGMDCYHGNIYNIVMNDWVKDNG